MTQHKEKQKTKFRTFNLETELHSVTKEYG